MIQSIVWTFSYKNGQKQLLLYELILRVDLDKVLNFRRKLRALLESNFDRFTTF